VRLFETALKQRRRGSVIRLELNASMPKELCGFVQRALAVADDEVFMVDGVLALTTFPSSPSSTVPILIRAIQSALSGTHSRPWRRRLRRHPAEGSGGPSPLRIFDVVVQFLQQAARDPNVVAIKQTLYRRPRNPQSSRLWSKPRKPEIRHRADRTQSALRRGSQHPLGARSRARRRAGRLRLHRTQTHAKLSMVVRREGGALATYVHVGTGNYHPVTARIYTDLSSSPPTP